MPGPGEIARGDEPVVAAAHDNDIGNRRCRLGWDAHESSAYPRVPLALAMQTPEHDLPMNLNTCVTAPIVPASLLPPVSCRSRPYGALGVGDAALRDHQHRHAYRRADGGLLSMALAATAIHGLVRIGTGQW